MFLAAAVLLLLTLITYLPILPGSFLMDDLRLIHLENPLATGQLTPANLWFQTDFPLSTLAFWWQWRAWGPHPALYHALSIALHAASALLLWRLLLRLNLRGAWVAAALFAVHPVCVNSVARVAELKNTLSLPFFLLSLACYLGYETAVLYPQPSPGGVRRSGTATYTLSLLAFILALLSKTSTVMLPLVLLACALWQRRRLTRRDLLHTSPYFVLALGFGMMSIWFQKHQALAGESLVPTTPLERSLLAARALGFYLAKAFVPVNLNLVYPRWSIDPRSAAAFVPLVLLGAGVVAGWRFRESWGRHALFGLACFGITLVPALGLVDAKFLTTWQVSDHLQYLSLTAVVALAAAALAWGGPGPARRLAATALLLAFGVLGFQRARVFSAEESLLRDTLAKNPGATSAHNDLGALLADRKDFTGALAEFKVAAESSPNDPAPQSNLGQVLGLLGQAREAETHLRRAIALKPADAQAHVRLARVFEAQNRNRDARRQLRVALRLKEDAAERLELAGLLYRAGCIRGAMAQCRRVLRTQPEHAEALNNLAWLLAAGPDPKARDGAEAVRCAEHACRLTAFKRPVFITTLAAAYAEAGRFPDAVATAESALRQETAAGQTQLAAMNQQLLARYYQAGKAYHEPAPPAAFGDADPEELQEAAL